MSNHITAAPPIVLTIAGFDPSGGAGTVADLKTFAAHGCYGIAAVTALTVQSTEGVKSVHVTPSTTLRAQLDALAEDVTQIAAVKIGMLGNKANAHTVAEFLDVHKFQHVVLDPVIAPTRGQGELIDAAGLKYLSEDLIKRSTVLTPNVPEAQQLTGIEIKDATSMEAAARKLAERGARAVVIKGGHLEKPTDLLFDGTEVITLAGDLIKSHNTHGSGCTFASAIAAQLACGRHLQEAVLLAKAYVAKAIQHGFAIGKGEGPLDHFYRVRQEPQPRGTHEVPQHGLHPAAEPASH
ncbi:MAG: bifunctional hydroxymethylpyrimidine kinase/phosphomethylpyrimidine kinase [Acidobacteria bacterium]|nr:bifunctional hydroxymethylpyrimidine kinase/phosphomethylpyrimidine kinase [Acidobacteriota bacterium]